MLRQLIYRDGGDLYEDAVTSGPVWQYYYNGRKRLVVVNKDGTDVSNYGYDFRGQRVWRSVFSPTSKTTHYVFDLQGHLLAEHDGNTGAVIKEYVWLDDAPLAVIDHSTGSAQIYYIHTGHLDEPQMMTDASKAKVWDAFIEPFGKAQVFGSAASLNLGLPGQWEQAEAGLSQNWNRDYDPSLGRYVQADPLGLAAGQNLYAYVDGKPTELVDPKGLAPPNAKVTFTFAPPLLPPRQVTFDIPYFLGLGLCIKGIATCSADEPSSPAGPSVSPMSRRPGVPRSKTERDECIKRYDYCDRLYQEERRRCVERYSYSSDAFMGCTDRAMLNKDLCIRGEPDIGWWSDLAQDGWVAPRPPRGRK